jgi:hypothetical protein
MTGREVRLGPAFGRCEELPQQRNTHVERQEQNVFHQACALLRPIPGRVGPILFRGDHCGDVFEKVDSTVIARTAMPLLMLARGTSEKERRVASRAKTGRIGRLRVALGTFHIVILTGSAIGARLEMWRAP